MLVARLDLLAHLLAYQCRFRVLAIVFSFLLHAVEQYHRAGVEVFTEYKQLFSLALTILGIAIVAVGS